MADYLADVQKYDSSADEAIVGKIVKHLGIALRNRDSALVSCTDPEELKRVREGWCKKKLGIADDAAADALIEKVCQAMSSDNTKDRVTFYYLVAKEAGKLNQLA